jgi:hypothetical protein
MLCQMTDTSKPKSPAPRKMLSEPPAGSLTETEGSEPSDNESYAKKHLRKVVKKRTRKAEKFIDAESLDAKIERLVADRIVRFSACYFLLMCF